jgi:uncharacterized protein YxeA
MTTELIIITAIIIIINLIYFSIRLEEITKKQFDIYNQINNVYKLADKISVNCMPIEYHTQEELIKYHESRIEFLKTSIALDESRDKFFKELEEEAEEK